MVSFDPSTLSPEARGGAIAALLEVGRLLYERESSTAQAQVSHAEQTNAAARRVRALVTGDLNRPDVYSALVESAAPAALGHAADLRSAGALRVALAHLRADVYDLYVKALESAEPGGQGVGIEAVRSTAAKCRAFTDDVSRNDSDAVSSSVLRRVAAVAPLKPSVATPTR